MEELKPDESKRCPFCGGEPDLHVYGEFTGLSPEIKCRKCPAKMRVRDETPEDIKKLVDAWNKRVEE